MFNFFRDQNIQTLANRRKKPQQNSFIFRVHVWIQKFVQFDLLGEKLQMPLWRQQASGFDILLVLGRSFFFSKCPKSNIFAKFETSDRGVNVLPISTIIPLTN